MFITINNHVEQALDRLIAQYKDATNLQGLLTALINPVQDIEGVLNDMNVLRQISLAFGQTLDNIGSIVGFPRPPGASDTDYRNDILGQVLVNVSQGQPEQVIRAFQLFTNASLVLLDEFFPAEVLVESDHVFPDQAAIDHIIDVIEQITPAGVRCDGIVTFDTAMAFAFDGVLSGSGFDDYTSPGSGGLLASLSTRNGYFGFEGDNPNLLGFGGVEDPLVGGWLGSVGGDPFFSSASVPSSGDSVTIQTQIPDIWPLLPALGLTGFSVSVNSSPATISNSVVQYNSQILLTISSPLIQVGDAVTVSYTPGNVTDSNSNPLDGFVNQSVVNQSTQ